MKPPLASICVLGLFAFATARADEGPAIGYETARFERRLPARRAIRFNFIHHPLSDLFVVYNDLRDDTGLLKNRSLIVKYTQLLSF